MIEAFLHGEFKDVFLVRLAESVGGTIHRSTKRDIKQYDVSEWPTFDFDKWTDKPVAVRGTLRGAENIIWEAQRRNHTFLYFDHAYFHATRDYKPGPHGLLYRLIKNQLQLNHLVDLTLEDKQRIQKYKPINIRNFQKTGKHILVLPPTPAIARIYGINWREWLQQTTKTIKENTDRQIVIRNKNEPTPLKKHLEDAWAMVTYQSTAAIESVLSGVPVFCEDIACAKPVAETDLTKIEQPFYPDKDLRGQWIDSLLSCQFTMDEIKNGTAYKTVMRLQ